MKHLINIIAIVLISFSLFGQTSETKKAQELLIIGDIHQAPKGAENAYGPILEVLLDYSPQIILGEYTVVGDTTAFGSWHSDFKSKYLKMSSSYKLKKSYIKRLKRTPNQNLSAKDFEALADYYLSIGDMANNWMYGFFKKYGSHAPFQHRGDQNTDLTFELMRKLGHKKIYGIDNHAGYSGYWPLWQACRNGGSKETQSSFTALLERLDVAEMKLLETEDKENIVALTNEPTILNEYYRINALRYTGFTGTSCDEQRKKWDNRNTLIAENILNVLSNTKKQKNVLIVGAGHVMAVQSELKKLNPDLKIIMYHELNQTTLPKSWLLSLKPPTLISDEYIKSKMNIFEVKNGQIVGKGKQEIDRMIDESQFLLLGEMHNSKIVSELTKALIPSLSISGYNTFVAEVGPKTAEKLKELSNPSVSTKKNLRDFNVKYSIPEVEGSQPIPFFTGVEDAAFLTDFTKAGMDIWGLDQEFLYSSEFLFDEILDTEKGSTRYEELKELNEKAKKIVRFWYIKEDQSEEDIDLFAEMSKEESIRKYLGAFENKKALSIINEMKVSWDIYSRWRQGSHADRISYMRNNFINKYNQLHHPEKEKFFLKFGSLHTAKEISNGSYDLGHLTEQLACENNTTSTSIRIMPIYYEEGGETKDYRDNNRYKVYYNRRDLFVKHADKERWVIFNLRSIRNDLKSKKISLPENGDYHALKKLIDNYDYLFIAPTNKDVTPNY